MKSLLVDDLLNHGMLLMGRHPLGSSSTMRRHSEIRADQLCLYRPSDEPEDVLTSSWTSRLPQIDVALGQITDGSAVLGGKPVTEVDGHGQGLFGTEEGGIGD